MGCGGGIDGHFERVKRAGFGSGPGAEATGGNCRIAVDAVDGLDFIQNTILKDHGRPAWCDFLGGLPEEANGSMKFMAMSVEEPGYPVGDGAVDVMSAKMSEAGPFRGVGLLFSVLDGKGIHIRPVGDERPVVFSLYIDVETGAGRIGRSWQIVLAEPITQCFRGFVFRPAGLGMLVQGASEVDQIFLKGICVQSQMFVQFIHTLSGAERGAATAGAGGIGVIENEPSGIKSVVEIDGDAAQIKNVAFVNDYIHTLGSIVLVIIRALVKSERITEA